MRRGFDLLLLAATTITVAFLILPLAGLFLRVPIGELIAQLGSPAALDALLVSLKTSVIAHVIILLVGTPAAYLLAMRRFRGRGALVALIELPLVLPPAVAGIGLLAAFGRRGLLGGELEAFGVSLPFTQAAVILAILFVASPFYVRQAISSFESVDREVLDAARTLGATPRRVFGRVALPMAWAGLSVGSALAFARGLGEFGATIMFAGSLPGVTETLPLAIYAELDTDFTTALALGALLVLVSGALLLLVRLLPAWTSSPSTSLFRFARSSSGSTSA